MLADVHNEEGRLLGRENGVELGDLFLHQRFRKAAAEIVGIARINHGIGEIFAVIAHIAVGDVENGHAHGGLLEHGIGNVARGVNGGEQAGLAAERLLGDQGGDGVAVGGGIVQDQ